MKSNKKNHTLKKLIKYDNHKKIISSVIITK